MWTANESNFLKHSLFGHLVNLNLEDLRAVDLGFIILLWIVLKHFDKKLSAPCLNSYLAVTLEQIELAAVFVPCFSEGEGILNPVRW